MTEIVYAHTADFTGELISTAQMKSICLTIIRNTFNGTVIAVEGDSDIELYGRIISRINSLTSN